MPRFSVPVAPKCAKCAQSVYHVEQVLGPMAKTYHKHCLTCIVCGKRLDSTLLVEHDGDPFCKHCHKEHLGTGKGGFATAVKLNPVSPTSIKRDLDTGSPGLGSPAKPAAARFGNTASDAVARPLTHGRSDSNSTATSASARARSPSPTKPTYPHGLEDQGVAGITIRARGTPSSPVAAPTSPSKTSSRPYASRAQPSTPIRSLDEAVASSSAQIRDPVSRLIDSVGGLGLHSVGHPDDAIDGAQPLVAEAAANAAEALSGDLPSSNYYDDSSAPPTPSRSAAASASSPTAAPDAGTDAAAVAAPLSPTSPSTDSSAPPVVMTTRRIAAADTIGSIRLAGDAHVSSNHSPKVNTVSPLDRIGALPPPRRPDPKTLTGAAGIAKIAPPRMTINPNTTTSPDRFGLGGLPRQASEASLDARAAKGGIERLGLGSIISDAGGGTPLCARCQKPVYFAEQKAAAGRKWHRACLRCDGCSTTLDTGKLEEGPIDRAYKGDGANVWCRTCYAKYFGPKNLAVGLSLPDTLPP
ncbi:hypothetical protein ACQY0O_000667 [Thecaphora frezii]